MLAQLEQQQQVIDALLETRKQLIAQQIEASAGLAQQMAALSFNMPQAGRKKRRSQADDEMQDTSRFSGSTEASWALSSFDKLETLDGEDAIVYRSMGDAEAQAEAAQRESYLQQLAILSHLR